MSLAKELWMWTQDRDIILSAQHIPRVSNTIADIKSRILQGSSDWMLCPHIFHATKETYGTLEVDLFASRLTYQMPRFFSWRPDPLVEAVDAFQQNWGLLRDFANNPQWCLIGGVSSPASPTSVGGTSVEGSCLVPSTPGNVVGLSQTDYSSSRSDTEANRYPDGDGFSTICVACLLERFTGSCLQRKLLDSSCNHGRPSWSNLQLALPEIGCVVC